MRGIKFVFGPEIILTVVDWAQNTNQLTNAIFGEIENGLMLLIKYSWVSRKALFGRAVCVGGGTLIPMVSGEKQGFDYSYF